MLFFFSFLFGLDDDDQKGLTLLLPFFPLSPTLAIGLNLGLELELTGAPGGGGEGERGRRGKQKKKYPFPGIVCAC